MPTEGMSMNEDHKWELLPFLKKTGVFLGLAFVIAFIGSASEMGIHEFLLGSPLPTGHIYSKIWGYIIFGVLIPVVYMSGVSPKRRIVIFIKGAFTLAVFYFSYSYLVSSLWAFVKPALFSNSFRFMLFLQALKGVVAMLAGLYVSVQSMRFEKKKASFSSYPFPVDIQPSQDETQTNPLEPASLPDPVSQRPETIDSDSSVEILQDNVVKKLKTNPVKPTSKLKSRIACAFFILINVLAFSILLSIGFDMETFAFYPLLVSSSLTVLFLLWPGRHKDLLALMMQRKIAEEQRKIDILLADSEKRFKEGHDV